MHSKPKQITPLAIRDFTLSSCLGHGIDAHWNALKNEHSGLTPCTFYDIQDLKTWTGTVPNIEQTSIPNSLRNYDCRNHRIALKALQQDRFQQSIDDAISRYGNHRIGVFMGTSTSGIHQTELAYMERARKQQASLSGWYHYSSTHNIHSISRFVSQYLGLKGLSSTISTACSSSAKVFATAHRAIDAGLCDAALVGGADSLCLTTLYGFSSLQVTAEEICRPSDEHRQGISIGEAAGFALLERTEPSMTSPLLLGYGESGDAHHMSSPHPEGEGAQSAMQQALLRAGLTTNQIDYVNLHGTGTPANDLAESKAVCALLGKHTPCSSTKGWTGHTLGAAGIVEAIFSLLFLKHQWLPKSLNTLNIAPDIEANILQQSQHAEVRHILSNSFGFGGSNCSIVLGAGGEQ